MGLEEEVVLYSDSEVPRYEINFDMIRTHVLYTVAIVLSDHTNRYSSISMHAPP